jgi:hypothetical protein
MLLSRLTTRGTAMLGLVLAASLLTSFAVTDAGAHAVTPVTTEPPVTSSTPQNSGVTERIRRGFSISGTVSLVNPATGTTSTLNGFQAWVDIYNSTGNVARAYPDDNGAYSFTNLAPGTYFLNAGNSGMELAANEDASLSTGADE